MIRVVSLVVGVLVSSAWVSAQDAVSEVRQAMEAIRAAELAKDAKAVAPLLADDLRWLSNYGTVYTKEERLQRVATPAGAPPNYGDLDIRIVGDAATVAALATFADGSRVQVLRAFVKQDGRWQLVLHAAVRTK
jgi:ketosteroid isomerase-like protein